MRLSSPAAILFDVDGTLMDDGRAVLLALSSFHSSYGHTPGLSVDDLAARWRELLNARFERYLAGEMSMQDERRALSGCVLAVLGNGDLAQQTSDVQSRLRKRSYTHAGNSAFTHDAACAWETTWRLTLAAAPPRAL
jgi:phosphoglycolate phosphatase-like HAD superfamily hydrolase